MATAVTPGQVVGIAGVIGAYGESQAQKAAAINQQTSYLLQARDTLAVAEVRADMSEQYSTIQAGRTIKKAELEAQNYQIAGNSLLKNMRATNAAIRARAAASGVVLGEGSVQAVQRENVAATMRDVGIADLNALTARVLGFEDASAMLESTDYQNMLNLYSARSQAGQLTFAGSSARKTGGILANATLLRAGTEYLKVR
jgi:predicted HicB family RNase H-like nuclease